MTPWAPLIYGRTLEVDFRFLAVPEDFSDSERKWAENHVLGTTRTPEALDGNIRWALFQEERHVVFGVAAMMQDLFGIQEPGSNDITRDIKGRPLYGFVGYVAKLDTFQDRPSIPTPAQGLELFRPLEAIIRARWNDRSFDIDKDPRQPYSLTLPAEVAPARPASTALVLNKDARFIRLWPIDAGDDLWLAARTTQQRISVCLGLASSRDAVTGPFVNATTTDAGEEATIERSPAPMPESIPAPAPIPPSPSPLPAREPARPGQVPLQVSVAWDHMLEPSPFKITGGVIGGTIGFTIGGGPTPFGVAGGLLGFGAGWVVGAIVEEQFVPHEAAGRSSPTTHHPASSDEGYGMKPSPSEQDKKNDTDRGTNKKDWF